MLLLSLYTVHAVDCAVDPAARDPAPASVWYQTYWEPCIDCAHRDRIGKHGDGGKWACLDNDLHNSVAISIGSNNDFSFEEQLTATQNITVDVFDHTSNPPNNSIRGVTFYKRKMTKRLLLHVLTTADQNGDRVGILKLDCEGCEHKVFSKYAMRILKMHHTQIMMETHYVTAPAMANLWAKFVDYECYPFHKEANLECVHCMEFAFIC